MVLDLTQNYPIIVFALLIAIIFLGWKCWNDRHLTDVGHKMTERVRDILSDFKCTIVGDQVTCKRSFANLGKHFSLDDAVDSVVRSVTKDLSVIEPYADQIPGRQGGGIGGGGMGGMGGGMGGMGGGMGGMGGGMGGMGGGMDGGMGYPGTQPGGGGMGGNMSTGGLGQTTGLGGSGTFGGLQGAGGFSGGGLSASSMGGMQGAPQQQFPMGSRGLINPGTSGAPPPIPPELQPMKTSIKAPSMGMGDMGGGGMGGGGMGGGGGTAVGGYDPDSW